MQEISFKTFGFFDRFEQRNRWWGCEIRYDGDGKIEILKKLIQYLVLLTINKRLQNFITKMKELQKKHMVKKNMMIEKN